LSCKTTYDNFNSKSDKKKLEFVHKNLNELNGIDLGNFIYQLQQENVDFTNYNILLKAKLKNCEFAYDFYVLSNLLSQKKENNSYLESIINDKITLWDSGNWAEKMWKMIENNNFNISNPNYYAINKGIKIYNFQEFLNEKNINNELGKNPLLTVNYDMVFYKNGALIKIIDSLNIKQIDYKPISESIKLYGKRGKDGIIYILTK